LPEAFQTDRPSKERRSAPNALEIVGRVAAFSLVIAGAALMPAPLRAMNGRRGASLGPAVAPRSRPT
jgi:hypothetical protein